MPPGSSADLNRPLLTVFALALAVAGCDVRNEVIQLEESQPQRAARAGFDVGSSSADDELSPRLLRRFAPIEASSDGRSSPVVELGRVLYHEPLLSRTGKVSCNSCHPLDAYGTTPTARSTGVDGQEGTRNAPTTYNAAGSFRQFWDGRAATLEEQAKGPIQNPVEMNMRPEDVVAVLQSIPGYQPLFARAFSQEAAPISFDNVALSIAEFERKLLTPSRWDRYLRGDRSALASREKAGAKLFANFGCVVCHTGAYIGGNMIEKLGVHAAWPHTTDRGRREVSSNPADDMLFKVPTLRNITRTGPYFHDGSVEKLDDAVRVMARLQLGVDLADDEVDLIVAWFDSLTGELPDSFVSPPTLPEANRP